ncbi:TniQ family protein [Rhodovulum sulfidophilum]|nr:TniQ family protein [Rhodovulum sulfidophilum]
MVAKLRLVVEPSARETLPSFFARMATLNGTDVSGFALDLGVSFRRILEQDPTAITTFATRSGLTPEQRTTLLSLTGERAGDVRMRFRGEIFVSRALRNPVVRACPHCLRERAEGQAHPLRHMTMSGDWQCRGVDLCLKHRHPLVPLWTRMRPIERDDISARLAGILPDLLEGRFDRETVTPSEYDRWLDLRLSEGRDETWLATQPLFSAMTFCDLLGAALLRKRGEEADGRAARATGFAVASRGPDSIRGALEDLTQAGDGGHIVTQGELKPVLKTLGPLYRDDDSFGGFRDIVRTHLLEIWPLAAGEDILGHTLPERRLHSLGSASRETGIGTAVLNAFLTEAGAFSPDDARAESRKTFDAKAWQSLLDEIPALVGPIAMRKAMGATLAELKSLEADGVLVPRTRVATIKSPWRISDGLSFLDDLEQRAIPVDGETPGWETIQLVHKRLGAPAGRVIAAIRTGSLRLGKRPDVLGYHGFVVNISEASRWADQASTREALKIAEGGMSVSVFARSAGIRGKDTFQALIDGGHTPATEVLNPRTKRLQWQMTSADIAAFHEKFATLTIISEETGAHRTTILAALASLGIERFQPDGRDIGSIYLRQDLAPVLDKLVPR